MQYFLLFFSINDTLFKINNKKKTIDIIFEYINLHKRKKIIIIY